MDFRIQKTYRAFHNAFTKLLREKRLEEFTVNELCDRAMLRRTTFYKHFADKNEYYGFYLREVLDGFVAQLPAQVRQCDRLSDYFTAMSVELLRFLHGHRNLVHSCMQSNTVPLLLIGLSDMMTEDALRLLRRSSKNTMSPERMESLAAFYTGGCLNTLWYWLRQSRMPEDAELASSIAALIGGGY